jgi:hypothetical protein
LPLLKLKTCLIFSAVGYGSGVGVGRRVVGTVVGVVTGAAIVVDSEAGWGVCSFGDFAGLLEHPLINIMAIIIEIIRT